MKERLIVALDVPSLDKGKELVDILDNQVVYYKVGLELFLNTRGQILDYLKAKEKKIFLDLKFHDIPNTVANAAKWAASLGVDMFNVHAGGGEEMLVRTKEGVQEVALKEGLALPLVIGVTVLTSFDEGGFKKLGFNTPISQTVLDWALMCKNVGLDGVVSSPQEAKAIKELCGQKFYTVCPGVRPLDGEKGDQKRIMTPATAIREGSDYIVVGRPIIQSPQPYLAAKKIIQEMEEVK